VHGAYGLRHIASLLLVAEWMASALQKPDVVIASDDDIQVAQGGGVEEESNVTGVKPIEAAGHDHPSVLSGFRRKGIFREATKGSRWHRSARDAAPRAFLLHPWVVLCGIQDHEGRGQAENLAW